MSKAKTEVAKKEDNELMEIGVDFLADSGSGMEGADKDSFAIPFISILQKISPQVDEADAAFIEGAKGGQFFNTVTQKLYDGKEGVIFLPCAYQRRFLHWGPRGTQDGGFKGELMPEKAAAMLEAGEVVNEDGKLWFPNAEGKVDQKKCDYLADTRNHFGILIDEATGEAHQVLMSLASTQIKKSKQLMSLLNSVKVRGPEGMVTPPTWMNKIRLTAVIESNDKGSWHGLKITPEGFINSKDEYELGKSFHQSIAAGEAKVNYAEAEKTEATEGADGKF